MTKDGYPSFVFILELKYFFDRTYLTQQPIP